MQPTEFINDEVEDRISLFFNEMGIYITDPINKKNKYF